MILGGPVLHRAIYAHWDEPPEVMAFELTLSEALADLTTRLERILPNLDRALADPPGAPSTFWDDCLAIYLRAPALVNIALNYKICMEQGLPLHPTHYFEVREKDRHQVNHPPVEVERAQTLFLDAIATARSVVALAPGAPYALHRLRTIVPDALRTFVYTSTQDRYTWRASEPRKIQSLAEAIRSRVHPIALVGAAHGSIMAGLLLANLLGAPLYFIRFSLFKRKDPAPVIAPSDLTHLATFRRGPVILFDEDVAKGTTLKQFAHNLKPFFDEAYTAGVLRHRHADIHLDFVGEVWSD